MTQHPYSNLPDQVFWRRAVANMPAGDINPAINMPFTVSPRDRVATAGSCFAQYIGPMLQNSAFNFFVTEPAHPVARPESASAFCYGIFSARYGNIYTARQLLQLFNRAHGGLQPREDVWQAAGGFIIDPFRPQIQPNGFTSMREFRLDREQHFAAVRKMFEQLDVFVFTLGLTEAWRARSDGAVFPLCPGVAGGEFDPEKHEFHNFTVAEVTSDLVAFADALRAVNPRARIVLTVSPVPLVATARKNAHVLSATTYSKSVLRVAAEQAAGQRPGIAYFPAYEIISARYDSGTYYAEDRRSVTAAGVAHVMRAFFTAFAGAPVTPGTAAPAPDPHYQDMEALMKILCEEAALDPE